MSDTLALAGRLQTESDDALITLLTARNLSKRDLRDFFDLADALLSPDSVHEALSHLDRHTLGQIGTGSVDTATATPALRAAFSLMLLVEEDGRFEPYDGVRSVLLAWPERGLPSIDELVSGVAPTSAAPPSLAAGAKTDEIAAERAFETTVAVTELATALQTAPARELAKGGLAVPDAKRLAAATGLAPEAMNSILRVSTIAGLTHREGASWFGSATAGEWMLQPLARRWGTLASAWLDALPPQIVDVLRSRLDSVWGEPLAEYLRWLYPAGGDELAEQIDEFTIDAERLGIAGLGLASAAGAALLQHGEEEATAALSPLLPAEVSTVYLQHDLTVVAPGPLLPEIDRSLRAMAHVESRSIASTYRISSGSIARALAAGYTAAGIRSFLQSISSSGIPQPLDYLISESSARYGLLRAGSLGDSGSYVRSDDGQLLHTIAVDQSLGSLGLVFSGDSRLTSRFSLETVYWLLVDARYPVIAEAESGEPLTLTRFPNAPTRVEIASRPVDELINRLRGSGVRPGTDTAEAWLVRQLDVAVKAKSTVLVTVKVPNGSEMSFLVVPTSLGSGRLRATDPKAGVERTLPLASITQVQVVSPVT
ncbi:helicase-associated domain-containing protein [Subtercola frigoramans]|uniref:Helicase XPB/Ssl2 N-terminal domain-containing protein n=1 Tax=Subtercola frigoramans TaxID=120298 RepID=A0ABS2L347_9MICO|nr:helicase-associated domain-containing protein [Subtercola frigoramans]MBM7471493.1 hypothetical protein [Subtercola frigoramans]